MLIFNTSSMVSHFWRCGYGLQSNVFCTCALVLRVCICIHTYSMQREAAGVVLWQKNAFQCKSAYWGKQTNGQHDYLWLFRDHFRITAGSCPRELSQRCEFCDCCPGLESWVVHNCSILERRSSFTDHRNHHITVWQLLCHGYMNCEFVW